MTVFEDMDRKAAFDLWLEGYKLGRNVESIDDIGRRVARKRFEQYLSQEYE